MKNHLVRIGFYLAGISAILCQDEHPHGIRFYSVYDDTVSTSLDLTPNPIELSGSFAISFELAIWKKSPFGFIVHSRESEAILFILSYIDFQNPDTSYFELTLGQGDKALSIGLPKSSLTAENWIHTELGFDLENQMVYLKMDDQKVEGKVESPKRVNLDLAFGRYPHTNDSPNMIIRNIQLKGEKERKWTLDEGYGKDIIEKVTGEKGQLTGGKWLMENHYKWETKFQRSFDIGPYIEYFSGGNSFIFTFGDSLMTLHCQSWESEIVKMDSALDSTFDMIDDPFRNILRGFLGGGEGTVIDWDPKSLKWNMEKPLKTKDAYHGSGKIINPRNGNFYTIGGYGHYQTNNHLLKYDETLSKWDTLSVNNISDAPFNPRQVLSTVWDEERDGAILFVGWGNDSGEQKKGFEYSYDLWLFSPDELILEKLWEWRNPGRIREILAALSIPGRNEYFFIARKDKAKDSPLLLFKGMVGKRDFENIQFQGLDWQGHGGLFYLNETNEMAFVQFVDNDLGNSEAKMSTIALPIINLAPILDELGATERNYELLLGLVLLLMVSMGIGIWMHNHRQKNGWADRIGMQPIAQSTEPKVDKNGITIQIEGEFQLWVDGRIFNLNGIDRHQQIMELLALVAKSPNHRVSHDDIHQSLWPLVRDESFVNSLNVTLSALRKVISPYEKEIIHQNKMVGFGDGINVI